MGSQPRRDRQWQSAGVKKINVKVAPEQAYSSPPPKAGTPESKVRGRGRRSWPDEKGEKTPESVRKQQKRHKGLVPPAEIANRGAPSAEHVDAKAIAQKYKMETPSKKKKRKGSQMGQLSRSLGFTKEVVVTLPQAMEAIRALCLTSRQLKLLKRRFAEVDVDGSGTMDAGEFFGMLGEERTPLTDELFKLIDLDGNGTIEFDEYVVILMTFCMYSKDDILRFCFDTFDKDHSNAIDDKEFIHLLEAVNNGSPAFPGNFKTALEGFDTNDDGMIDFAEFKVIDRRFPLIFFPAYRLQDAMQKNTLGQRAWCEIHERVQQQRRLNEYRRTHGNDPPKSRLQRATACFAIDRGEIDIDLIDSKKPALTSLKAQAERKRNTLQQRDRARRTL